MPAPRSHFSYSPALGMMITRIDETGEPAEMRYPAESKEPEKFRALFYGYREALKRYIEQWDEVDIAKRNQNEIAAAARAGRMANRVEVPADVKTYRRMWQAAMAINCTIKREGNEKVLTFRTVTDGAINKGFMALLNSIKAPNANVIPLDPENVPANDSYAMIAREMGLVDENGNSKPRTRGSDIIARYLTAGPKVENEVTDDIEPDVPKKRRWGIMELVAGKWRPVSPVEWFYDGDANEPTQRAKYADEARYKIVPMAD